MTRNALSVKKTFVVNDMKIYAYEDGIQIVRFDCELERAKKQVMFVLYSLGYRETKPLKRKRK